MKGFIMALAAALTAALAVGAVVVLIVGGTDDEVVMVAEGASAAQVEDEAAPAEESTQPGLAPIEQLIDALSPSTDPTGFPSTQRVVLSRDPFRPVVPEPATDGDGTDGGSTDGGSTDGGSTDGGSTDGGSTGADLCTGDESEVVCNGIVVTLEAITDEGLAIVRVDGTTYTVGEGDEFAQYFKVLSIDDPRAEVEFVQLQLGDDTFFIRTGVTVLK